MLRGIVQAGFVTAVMVACAGCGGTQRDSALTRGGVASALPAVPAAAGQTSSAANATQTIACGALDVKLTAGKDNSDFNGMSHSGTYLTLTNSSRNACSIPGVPQLTFLDLNGPVQTTADMTGAKLMHPGPQVVPIVLQPKQSVTTSARWVSGPVFQNNLCYKLTGVTLSLRHETAMTPLIGQMCGDRSKGVQYELKRYGDNS